jgi:hypothetical protein
MDGRAIGDAIGGAIMGMLVIGVIGGGVAALLIRWLVMLAWNHISITIS